jgi:hypothetical protein
MLKARKRIARRTVVAERTAVAEHQPSNDPDSGPADQQASVPEDGSNGHNVERGADYTKLGEHIATVLKTAKEAAERITDEAHNDAERLRERSQEETSTRLAEANLEAAKMLSEADQRRVQTEEASKAARERADTYANEKRREAEAKASKAIADAEQVAARRARAGEERQRTLRENVDLTEKRLEQLAAGLRDLAGRLETLVHPNGVPAPGDDGQTQKGQDALSESLRPSVTAPEAKYAMAPSEARE